MRMGSLGRLQPFCILLAAATLLPARGDLVCETPEACANSNETAGQAFSYTVTPHLDQNIVVRDDGLYVQTSGAKLFDRFNSKSLWLDFSDKSGVFVRSAVASSFHTITLPLGRVPHTTRVLALPRQRLWWMAPWFGDGVDQLPVETQFALLRMGSHEVTYAAVLPLVTGPFRTTVHGAQGGRLMVTVESGTDNVSLSRDVGLVLIVVDRDPYSALKRAFAAAADRLGTFATVDKKTLPPTLDLFGWCTWDAFYFDVDGEGIKRGLKSLKEGGTPARMLIIDDGWQDVKSDDERHDMPKSWPMKAASSIAGPIKWLVKTLQSSSLRYFRAKVFHAPLNSMHLLLWKFLSATVLRWPLMSHFAHNDVGSKRLVSPRASERFLSSLGSTAKAPLEERQEIKRKGGSGRLKEFVGDIKEDFGIKFVYCWHALLGYWGGAAMCERKPARMAQSGQEDIRQDVLPRFSKALLKVEPQLEWEAWAWHKIGVGARASNIPVEEDAKQLYSSMHTFLAQSGIDGVKCDVQAQAPLIGNELGGGAHVTRAYVMAMQKSVLDHFGPQNHCINCMCHPSECLYSFYHGSVARASDDFWPNDPPSHTIHIVNVVYNTLFLAEIAHPDWDMFQTTHPYAGLHAAARAVSGSAVYVSDHPKKHNIDLLKRLVLPNGHILRAKQAARPTIDTMFEDVAQDGVTASKVWNLNNKTAVVGAFNLQGNSWNAALRKNYVHDPRPKPVTAVIRVTDVHGWSEADPEDAFYAAWSTYWSPSGALRGHKLKVVSKTDVVPWSLESKESVIVTFSRVEGGVLPDGRYVCWAPIGLDKMMNAGGAVLMSEFTAETSSASCQFIGGGPFVAWSSHRPQVVTVDSKPVHFQWNPADGRLEAETAWKSSSTEDFETRTLEVQY